MSERVNAARIGIPDEVATALFGFDALIEDLQHLREAVGQALRFQGLAHNRAEIAEMGRAFRPRIDGLDRTFSCLVDSFDDIGGVLVNTLAGGVTAVRLVLDRLISDRSVALADVTDAYESGQTLVGLAGAIARPIPDLPPSWREPRLQVLDESFRACRPVLAALSRAHATFSATFQLATIGDLFAVNHLEASEAVEAAIQPLTSLFGWLLFTVRERNDPLKP
ncbi:hypothetical protein [Spirillospora sp. CA-294931]|uniref:hypothetical protein n=1 Tax=Spirillospora sp. CA-294931 TaxID=3240042 RepID=UPI003D8ABBD3